LTIPLFADSEATLCQLCIGAHMNSALARGGTDGGAREAARSAADVLSDGAVIVQHNCVRKCLQQVRVEFDDCSTTARRREVLITSVSRKKTMFFFW
jgi:AhpD family alkylhydroperoxidase